MFAGLVQDIRFAFRSLRRAPGFTAVTVVTIALGIGANTAIFSVVQAVLLQPLPFDDSQELVFVRGELGARAVYNWPISPRILLDMRERSARIEEFAGVNLFRATLVDREARPEQISVAQVTPNLFSMLGVPPMLGRDFQESDAEPLAPDADPATASVPTVMVAYDLWRNQLAGDPNIVGGFVNIFGTEVEVIGVMPANFNILLPADTMFIGKADAWFTPRVDLVNADRRGAMFEVIGRLAPGATAAQAQGEMDALVGFLHEISESSRGAGYDLRVVPMQSEVTAGVRPLILALLGAVGFVLLIACANVSNLLLVRATTRDGEFAVRAAVGGNRGRLTRQLLVESLLMAGLGAVLGIAIARFGINSLVAIGPDFPRMSSIAIDGGVLGFTLAITVMAAVVFGVIPALHASNTDVAGVLKARGRSSGLAGQSRLRTGVVVAEVALSVVLLVGAGLMMRSFAELQGADPGFRTEGVLTFELQLQGNAFPQDRRAAFHDELRAKLGSLPGVAAVTAADVLPLRGSPLMGRYGTRAALEDDALYGQAAYRTVLPDFFDTTETRLLDGHGFEASDFAGDGAKTVVIDNLVAARLWPGERAVGKDLVIRRGPEPEVMEVIGIVQHQRSQSPAFDSTETVYFNAREGGDPNTLQWYVSTTVEPGSLGAQVRQAVAELDGSLPVSGLRTMADVEREVMTPTRFALVLIGVFAVLAAALAAVGLYSVLAYVVRQRTGEIGLRMVFGARVGNVVHMVFRQALAPALTGIAIGLVAAWFLTRFMATLLVCVAPTDALTFAATALLFLVISALASALPAYRAARVDPIEGIRGD